LSSDTFHHSNWRLPIPVERILNLILVTRHAWDSPFHRAARDQFKLGHDVLLVGQAASHPAPGRAAGTQSRSVSLHIGRKTNLPSKLFALPFRAQREWRLPNGDVPDREPQLVEELAE